MEGLTGVVRMNQVVPGASEYGFGRKMLAHDLNAVLEGLLQEEDDEVVVYDIHFFGTNIEFDGLDPRVKVICGKPDYTPLNKGWLQKEYDGVILLGLHAKSGVPDAVLAHNYEHDITRMTLNGMIVGEIGLEAAVAGEAGVPVVMVTGDSEGTKEAEELLPGVLTVTVKQSTGSESALCDPPSLTSERLRSGAASYRERAALKPYVIDGPVELAMSFRPGELLNKLQSRLTDRFCSRDTMVLRGGSVLEVWEMYLQAKA
jgi:D-amino peptidase